MKKTKKMMAFALAASMVLGNSAVAFAAAGDTGSVSGSGTLEGHVDKEVLNVVLPTVETGSSAFSYTMDPERLIQGTDAAKYAEGTVFPDKATDTGVYFLTAANTYANTSNVYQAINKSSCDVTLTVKVKATATTGGTDINLATAETLSTTDPELYLALKVGNDSKIVGTTEQTVTKTIAGSQGNFNIAVKDDNGTKKYVYQEKADASTWKAMNISMTGKVNNIDVAANTVTAPTVDVTWSWAKAADGATADTDVVDYVAGPQITMTQQGLVTVTNLTATQNYESIKITLGDNSEWDINDDKVTWNDSTWSDSTGGSFTVQLGESWINFIKSKGGTAKVVLNLSDGTNKTINVTIPTA